MGKKLLGDVAAATGLPTEMITAELTQLVEAAGASCSEVTLDELRSILASYVQDILLQAKEEYGQTSGK